MRHGGLAGLCQHRHDTRLFAAVRQRAGGSGEQVGDMVRLHKDTYSSLFAAIGYTYGGSGGTFRAPDLRGVFPRGLDSGRGLDPGRKLGTTQQCGAPNIWGTVAGMDKGDNNWFMNNKPNAASGAFWQDMNDNTGDIYDGGGHTSATRAVKMSATRCSNVYGRSEDIRPMNIALNYIIKY